MWPPPPLGRLGIGARGVLLQAILSGTAAVALTIHLAWLLDRWILAPLSLVGVFLAYAYSVEPFRLNGRGMPDPRGGRTGDLLVQTFIEVPKKLTARQKELLHELAELEHANVTPNRKSFLEMLRDYFVPADQPGEKKED